MLYSKNQNSKTLKLLFILKFLFFSQTIFAQEAEIIKETQIDEIIIEATKTLSFTNSLIIATIERQEIQFAPVTNFQDLLNYLQSVDIRTRGVEGIQADVSIRGGTFDQTVVLLNGINFTDPQTGHFSLNLPIDISIIERIEILQGIDSWVSGVPAFIGAINIITKNPVENKVVSYHNYGMNYLHRAGVSITNIFSPKLSAVANFNTSISNGYAVNTDFQTLNGFLLLNYRDAKIGNFEFQTGYLEKEFGANSFYSIVYREQFEMNKVFISSLKYNNSFNGFAENHRINLKASTYYRQHKDRFELFRWERPDWYAGHNFHHTDVFGINASADYKWRLGISTMGADFRSEYIKSSNLGDVLEKPIPVPNQENTFYNREKLRLHQNAFLKHYYSAEKWDFNLGTMTSGSDEFGFRLISGGNFRYLLTNRSNILFAVQQGYRLPTFTDLYINTPAQKGSIGLLPEESINTEISYNWNNSKLFFQSNIFYRYGYRIIDWVRPSDDTTNIWHAKNFTNVSTVGYDISASYSFRHSFINRVKLNYSYLDVSKETSDNYLSLYATDFLRHQLNLGVLHTVWDFNNSNRILANWQFRFQSRAGSYVDADRNIIDYPTFLLCDLKVIWQAKHFDFFVEGTNLFDQQYVDIGNLPQPGIWLRTGINLNIRY